MEKISYSVIRKLCSLSKEEVNESFNIIFNNVYKIPGNEDCESHLEIIKKLGKQIILMYDVLQAIRPANVTREMFKDLTKNYEKRFLKTQFRIQAPKGKSYIDPEKLASEINGMDC